MTDEIRVMQVVDDDTMSPEEKLNKLVKESEFPQGTVLLEEEDKIVGLLVDCWNQLVSEIENKTIRFALMVQKLLDGYPEKTVTEIIEKVRKHPKLRKSLYSRDRIMQGIRLVRDRPDLVDYAKEHDKVDKKPYTKRDGTPHWAFYFTLYKYNMDPGIRLELEEQGKKEKWSTRKLRAEIRKEMEKYKPEPEWRRNAKKFMIKEIVIMLRCLEPEDLKMIREVIQDEYNNKLDGWKKWFKKKFGEKD